MRPNYPNHDITNSTTTLQIRHTEKPSAAHLDLRERGVGALAREHKERNTGHGGEDRNGSPGLRAARRLFRHE